MKPASRSCVLKNERCNEYSKLARKEKGRWRGGGRTGTETHLSGEVMVPVMNDRHVDDCEAGGDGGGGKAEELVQRLTLAARS